MLAECFLLLDWSSLYDSPKENQVCLPIRRRKGRIDLNSTDLQRHQAMDLWNAYVKEWHKREFSDDYPTPISADPWTPLIPLGIQGLKGCCFQLKDDPYKRHWQLKFRKPQGHLYHRNIVPNHTAVVINMDAELWDVVCQYNLVPAATMSQTATEDSPLC